MVTSCNTLHLDYLSHRIGALVLASPWDTGFHRQNQSILARSVPCSQPSRLPEKRVTITQFRPRRQREMQGLPLPARYPPDFAALHHTRFSSARKRPAGHLRCSTAFAAGAHATQQKTVSAENTSLNEDTLFQINVTEWKPLFKNTKYNTLLTKSFVNHYIQSIEKR